MMEKIWSFNIQVFPVLIAFGIFQIPSALHKLKKQCYVPIYFSIFPFDLINVNLSKYFAEDYFGESMSESDAEAFRKKLIYKSAISLTLSTLVIPAFTGFLGAFFLTNETLFQFLLLFLMFKLVTCVKSIVHFPYNKTKNIIMLSIVYFFYIGIVINIIKVTYNWAQPYIIESDWSGLLLSLNNLFFNNIGRNGIIFLIISSAFTYYIADRNIRKENLQRLKSNNEGQNV